MYLVDTNVFLEIFLRRENSSEAKRLLREIPFSYLYVTDLSLYTLGIILFKTNQQNAYISFLKDLFTQGEVWRVQLLIDNMQKVIETCKTFQLNYHDAYQYVVAQEYNLTLVSFNESYAKTTNGFKHPHEIDFKDI